jgi:hypothetical protein
MTPFRLPAAQLKAQNSYEAQEAVASSVPFYSFLLSSLATTLFQKQPSSSLYYCYYSHSKLQEMHFSAAGVSQRCIVMSMMSDTIFTEQVRLQYSRIHITIADRPCKGRGSDGDHHESNCNSNNSNNSTSPRPFFLLPTSPPFSLVFF